MKWYLIQIYDSYTTYANEFNSKKEAIKEYERYKHMTADECKIILAKGTQINKEV